MLLRATITKGEQVRYISHLDFARLLERSLRRANLPIAYSEGFNPHVKLAFASALSVGVIGIKEYFDIELTEELAALEFIKRLSEVLPEGVKVEQAVKIGKQKALMAVINYSTYTVELPLRGEFSQVLTALNKFNHLESVQYSRNSPKGRRNIEVKQFILEPIEAVLKGSMLSLAFGIEITPSGSIKASELIDVLVKQFGLPTEQELGLIRREGLWIKQGERLISPLEYRG